MVEDRPPTRLTVPDDAPIDRLVTPFRMFIHSQVASGLLLIGAAVVALVWANSPWAELYTALWETHVSIHIGNLPPIDESILHWINDGLMAMFFFVVGLEIKRELIAGELASPRLAALPLMAAVGGMLVPALIYVGFNAGTEEVQGWGIPMATDIAFSMGILYLLGDRVPVGLRIFLASLAIADDLGAVIAIALFYTSEISYMSLLVGAALLVFVAVLNRLGVRSALVYGIFGIGGVWFAFLFSGVHPTIAGVLMAMMIPATIKIDPAQFVAEGRTALDRFETTEHPMAHVLSDQTRQEALLDLDVLTNRASTPLQRLESALHPWVSIVVLPLFALANAGVVIDAGVGDVMADHVTLGIILGLLVGKQAGVTLFAWLSVRSGLARLPSGIRWLHVYGVSWLAGIGFTMSLFIAGLAFDEAAHLSMAKVGVLGASTIAGVVGFLILKKSGR